MKKESGYKKKSTNFVSHVILKFIKSSDLQKCQETFKNMMQIALETAIG